MLENRRHTSGDSQVDWLCHSVSQLPYVARELGHPMWSEFFGSGLRALSRIPHFGRSERRSVGETTADGTVRLLNETERGCGLCG